MAVALHFMTTQTSRKQLRKVKNKVEGRGNIDRLHWENHLGQCEYFTLSLNNNQINRRIIQTGSSYVYLNLNIDSVSYFVGI